jgi:hypothetical protein
MTSTAAKKASRSRCATTRLIPSGAGYQPPRPVPGRAPAEAVPVAVYPSSPDDDLASTRVSHDGDKLIRQLSLVAYLMAARRPVTARDAKAAVEGYADMSDEAFARRFYADRAELQTLGIPLPSQRDEFTGEELYTLPPEQYFLPPLHLSDAELRPCRPACTSSRASSRTPSRSGSRCRTWPSAGRTRRATPASRR